MLKENEVKPWRYQQWVIPLEEDAMFVYCMEDVLDLYHKPYDPARPLVCFEESNKQVIKEKRCQYLHSLVKWRVMIVNMSATEPATSLCSPNLFGGGSTLRSPGAGPNKTLRDEFYSEAECIRVVLDNLNTHTPAALYETFETAEAKRLFDKLGFHYTPRHGDWLNMAEIEFSVLTRQCLDRRILDAQTLCEEVEAWEAACNNQSSEIN